MTRTLRLNASLLGVGHHEVAWRHPGTGPRRTTALGHFVELARTAERGALDSLLLPDLLSVGPDTRHRVPPLFEPLTLLAALATVTEHIGLIATVSTTWHEPFHVARQLASLDHLSAGRAGWNVVASGPDREAANFNREHQPGRPDRYRRAAEFVDVAVQLWDSWEDDALILDARAGVAVDTDRVHEIDHWGADFQVRGPLTTPRPPQGRPLLVQTDPSADGIRSAARYAEVVVTVAHTLAEAQAIHGGLKRQIAAAGRNPDLVSVLAAITPVLGGTEAEARTRAAELATPVVPHQGPNPLATTLGVDLFGLPPGGASPARARVVAGTPEQIADQIELWFTQGAADGFDIVPPYLPDGLTDFVDQVVPILRARGLVRTGYPGRTLRDHYGLPRPANIFTAARTPALVTA
ncbi:NtaA/DmoA family FMN-dependent monooxygenase [Micromonospora echinofusca]|uniref:NtaA/DmoA family FMN-dependent monooxygenase n=1 Tax=Micromonospora echinofusca TaxID=47858 RepID=A0ABS3VMN6_MICEH|nr:NtaA/DmoA family FMN-dependent monooxygenase [Micromonospora echinofusca]MBO4205762.1 NtaA/DmoA family FMN-dependent monooxygenase [Micromonospora echinofusca]